MPENRNTGNGLSFNNCGTVCIDTSRVLDCCRDRDCFENTRVYLTAFGEETIAAATNVRIRSAKTLWAYVGVSEVPFNNGFYQITVRYYVEVECEACLGIGRSQTFRGLAILEKDVILFGGEGRVTSYKSGPENQFCSIGPVTPAGTNDPTAVVESVDPIVLGSKIDCECHPCCCSLNDMTEVPDTIRTQLDGDLVTTGNGPHLYVSFGLFSVIRIQRPTQLLVQATDYSVPEKECEPTGTDDPCALFRTIAFPVGQFQGTGTPQGPQRPPRGGCSSCSGGHN